MACWGGRYFLDLIGEVPLVIDEFEDGILLKFPRLWVSQDREAVTVMPDDQVLREAVVQLPASPSEALFYPFLVHSSLCPSPPTHVETLTYHFHCEAAHEFPRTLFGASPLS